MSCVNLHNSTFPSFNSCMFNEDVSCVNLHNSAFPSFNSCMFNEDDGTYLKNKDRKEF